jgi:hypothetical protein
MKTPAPRLVAIASAMAVVSMLALSAYGADKEDPAAKKSKRDAEILRKYDKNGNGKLDPDEEAAMKADQARAKAPKKKKKEKDGDPK